MGGVREAYTEWRVVVVVVVVVGGGGGGGGLGGRAQGTQSDVGGAEAVAAVEEEEGGRVRGCVRRALRCVVVGSVLPGCASAHGSWKGIRVRSVEGVRGTVRTI